MDVVVRPAAPGDVEAIIDGFRSVAAEERWIGTQPGFDEDLRREGLTATIGGERPAVSLVAETADGAVVGFCGLQVSRGVAHLGMWLLDGWRGRGLGRALLDEGVGACRARGDVHKIELELWPHNEAAHRLYRRAGFEVEGRRRRHWRRRDGSLWDSVLMALVLDHELPGSPHADALTEP